MKRLGVRGPWLALVMVIVMIMTFVISPKELLAQSAASDFKDLKKSDWYYDYVMILAERGIVQGYGETGQFRPASPVIRKHAAKMVVFAAGLPLEDKIVNFPDVDPEDDMLAFMAALVVKDAARTFPDGSFRPLGKLTRGEAARMIQTAFDLKLAFKDVYIKDAPASDPELADAIEVLASNGIIKGYGKSGNFKPEAPINRAEFSKMLCMAMAAKAVQKAEDHPSQASLNYARSQVSGLPAGQDRDSRDFLQARLNDMTDGEPQTRQVTFNPNGGAFYFGELHKITVALGRPYGYLPRVARKDYSFLGWYTEKEGGSLVQESTPVSLADSHVLYAHWEKNFTLKTVPDYHAVVTDVGKFKLKTTVTYNSIPAEDDWADHGDYEIRLSRPEGWPELLTQLTFIGGKWDEQERLYVSWLIAPGTVELAPASFTVHVRHKLTGVERIFKVTISKSDYVYVTVAVP
ncbi:MAG: hypothetical protein GX849_03320 [Clostridiaceae bacterium]|nr:hypothetical protein [Clostridiaceae bacterium]